MLIDSHVNLHAPQFAEDQAEVIARARAAGVRLMVNISDKVSGFEAVQAVAQGNADIWCTVGTHPHEAKENPDLTAKTLIDLAGRDRVVGIGETGLDYYYDLSPRDIQRRVFAAHIEAARETGLPLVIHARDADADVEAILRAETGKGAFPFVLHCFSSGERLAKAGIELGGYVSFSGILTFPKSTELRDIAATLPHDRLLVETDAPYLAPPPHRGKRNEPAFVVNTARVLAQTLNVSEAEIADITTANFFRLFSKARRPGESDG